MVSHQVFSNLGVREGILILKGLLRFSSCSISIDKINVATGGEGLESKLGALLLFSTIL